jgi:hypothetical protein
MTDNATPMPGTALPWRATDDFACQMIGTKEADICEMQDWPLEFIPEQQANAAYIVWACNNAPALLSALEKATDAIFAAGLTADNTETWRAARAAIASAGGRNG